MSARHEIDAQLKGASRVSLELAAWRAGWIDTARAKQLPPTHHEWDTWLLLAGRGFGKTRIGAEEIGYQASVQPGTRWAVIAPTQSDVRSVCFEGESGLLKTIPKIFRLPGNRGYNSQALQIRLRNGSLIQGYSAEKPDRLRGPQFHGAWCDELASWGASSGKSKVPSNRLQDTWDNLQFGLRLGDAPKIIVTTTPRPIDFLRSMVKDARTVVTSGSTFENSANLASTALATFRKIYEGTRRGQQELYAEILEQAEGALWSAAMLEPHRAAEYDDGFIVLRSGFRVAVVRIAVAVDPAITTEEQSDETGIIVAALGEDGRLYVLEDSSGKYSPREWARIVLSLFERYKADAIVAEVNQGGDLVAENLKAEAEGRYLPIKEVHAKRGKYLRAEPIAAYYEKGVVSHVGHYQALENQMLNYQGFTGENSPDRLDALVYAIGELMLGTVTHAFW